MIRKSIISMFVLMAIIFVTENSFAQNRPTPGVMNGGILNGNIINSGRLLLSPERSANALWFLNYGSRYLLPLSEPYPDPNGSGCLVQPRAWIASVEANNGKQINVRVGPARNVLLCNGALSVEQVNNLEGQTQTSRKAIYEWQKYQQQVLNNPGEYQRATAWINWYTQFINNAQAQVARVAP